MPRDAPFHDDADEVDDRRASVHPEVEGGRIKQIPQDADDTAFRELTGEVHQRMDGESARWSVVR